VTDHASYSPGDGTRSDPKLVNPVTGSVLPADLGIVLVHKHIVTPAPSVAQALPETFPTYEIMALCSTELTRLRSDFGVSTIDRATVELGRDTPVAQKMMKFAALAQAATGLPIEREAYQ
jgi:predicted metal-dependent phosphotriesterase family hydrolase